jgi:hypothetical protein
VEIKKYFKNNWFFRVTKTYTPTCSSIETYLKIIRNNIKKL